MYFFIFDQVKNSKQRTEFEKIKDIAREYQILSNSAHVSPARTARELTEEAFSKSYTTIVAIGDDTLINDVASAIINLAGKDHVTLGIISTNPESLLQERWGFKTYEEALETLKFRKLERFTVGMVESDNYFLSSARIECSKPTRVQIEIDRFKAEGVIDRLEISNNLYILLERYGRESSLIKSTLNWFQGRDSSYADRSVFRGKLIKISSKERLPILIGKRTVAYTPVNVYRKINALNIITKRDRIIA